METFTLKLAAHRARLPWKTFRDLCNHDGLGPRHITALDGKRRFCPLLIDLWVGDLAAHPVGTAIEAVRRYYQSPRRVPIPQQRCPVFEPETGTDPCSDPEPIAPILDRTLTKLLDGRIRPVG